MMGARWLLAALAVAALGTSASAQPPIEPSGVTLVAPRDAVCPAIVLPFGVAARYATNRHAVRHDGIDFKVPDETPLLAIAAGKVIGLGAGSRSTGRYVWIQHAPGDTGLPFWVDTLYQHFDPTPELDVGVVLKVGQVIGSAGQPAYPKGRSHRARPALLTTGAALALLHTSVSSSAHSVQDRILDCSDR